MHSSGNAIEARGLVKAFGDNRAVDGLASRFRSVASSATERHLMAGTARVSEVVTVPLAAAITVVFLPLTMWLYRRRT